MESQTILTQQNEEFEKGIEAAYEKAFKNLINFRSILLITGDQEVEPADFHFKWSDSILSGTQNEAWESFRESAKTQYILRAFFLYCLTFPSQERDFLVLIKNNQTLAENKLKEIETEFMSNPALAARVLKINQCSGKVFDVDLEGDEGQSINVRIEAYGKGASIRGLAIQDRRPKVCVIDDPQDLEDAKSETVLESDWNWFLSDIKFLGQYTRIFMIGNNLGEKCMIERVAKYAADLGFNFQRIPIADKDGNPTWPAKNTREGIQKEKEAYIRIGKLDIWLREKMCLATSKETQILDTDDLRWFHPDMVQDVIRGCNGFATLDPAHSKQPGSCYRALCANFVNEDNYWFVPEIAYGRWSPKQTIDNIFEFMKRWKLKTLGIEKGEFKDIIEPFIYEEMRKRNMYFNIVPIEHAKIGSKLERIKMLEPRLKAHTIYFPLEAYWVPEAMTEMQGVTKDQIKSEFIDLIDALAMMEQIAVAPYGRTSDVKLPREAEAGQTIIGSGFQPSPVPASMLNLPREAVG